MNFVRNFKMQSFLTILYFDAFWKMHQVWNEVTEGFLKDFLHFFLDKEQGTTKMEIHLKITVE